ncbi:MAG: cryptochrome/photolyase family protein [Myxococcota bacterium]
MASPATETVWVLGDQLNRATGALRGRRPGDVRVLLIESDRRIQARNWHRQRLHLYLTAMRRFARELEKSGFEVDYRRAPSFRAGLEEHRRSFRPDTVTAMTPSRFGAARSLADWNVSLVPNDQFLCSPDAFRAWAGDRQSLRMETFYRWQRERTGYLMEDGEPAEGRWNYDTENRKPATADDVWPAPPRARLDDLDREVLDDLGNAGFGDDPEGWWATSRRQALGQLRHFVKERLPVFGPHQDALTERSWHLAHALLSPALNLGLLHPREVCDAVEKAYRAGDVPIASAEGFLRQVIGWREYVWGLYWLWMPDYRRLNRLEARRALLPCFEAPERTEMRCVAHAVGGVRARGWSHHIERLMVLANLALLTEVRPQAFLDWMERSYVDAAEWVMVPNVIGMGLHADGGRMASKPYAAGGAYVNRMSDHCGACRYDPKQRTGERACPLSSLYWRFVDRHRERLARNPRTSMAVRSLDKLRDRDATLERANQLLRGLSRGKV